jgi:hypothetical protein
VRDVTLEVPLRALALGRGGQRGDSPGARARALGDALDDAALACRVAALEDDDRAQALDLDVLLQQDELALQALELLLEELALELRLRRFDMFHRFVEFPPD